MDWLTSLDTVSIVRLVVVGLGGLATGFVGAMVGVVLGRPRLLLVYWAAENPVNAPGTNILVSALATMAGTWRHFREGRIDFHVLALMGIPSVVGAFLGGFFGGQVPTAALLVVVGVLTTWYGYRLLTGRPGNRQQSGDAPHLSTGGGSSPAANATLSGMSIRRRLVEMSLGFGIGLFGGVVGLVLGQLRLPAMIQVLRMDPRIAAGTNLAISTAVGLFGFLGHALHLEVDWTVVVLLGSTAMLGSYLGAQQTGRVSPETLTRWMGGVMVITSLPIFWLAYIQYRAG